MQFDNMAVAATIRQLRTERGLSQEVLSSFAQILYFEKIACSKS